MSAKGIRRLTAEQLRGCRGVISYEIQGQWLVITMASGQQRKATLASVCQDLGRRLSWHPNAGYSKRRPPPEPEGGFPPVTDRHTADEAHAKIEQQLRGARRRA